MIGKVKANSIIQFITIVFFAASFLTSAYSSAKYIMAVCAVIIALFAAGENRGKLRVRIEAFHLFTFTFLLFCLISALWAINQSYTIDRVLLILQILAVIYLVYIYYQDKPCDQLLKIAMLGGYAVSLITLADQGLDVYIRGILTGTRIYDQEYINANTLGMLMASSIALNFYYIIYEKKIRWWTIFILPAVICLAGAGSRKSILLLIGGCFFLVVLHNFKAKKFALSLIRITFFVLLFVAAAYLIGRMSAFDLLSGRFETFFNYFTGRGDTDFSTMERFTMLRVGVAIFKNNPLFGIGIDNPKLLNVREVYLHNNYIELLAGGGIVGFCLYYFMYVYLLHNMIKYRAHRTGEYDVCLTLLLLHIVLEYGHVAYFNKETYFYFMIFFIEVKRLRKAAKESIKERGANTYGSINA